MTLPAPRWFSNLTRDGRGAFALWAFWSVQNKGKFVYTFSRPLELVEHETSVIHADCSWFVKLLAHWTGLENDPTFTTWGGWGNSTNIYTSPRNRVIPRWRIARGDLAVYGHNGSEHVAVIYRGGFNPLMIGDGEQGDPTLHPLSLDNRTPRYFVRIPMRTVGRPIFPPKAGR